MNKIAYMLSADEYDDYYERILFHDIEFTEEQFKDMVNYAHNSVTVGYMVAQDIELIFIELFKFDTFNIHVGAHFNTYNNGIYFNKYF